MQMPSDLQKSGAPPPDFSKVQFLPARKDVVYRDNAGYNLNIENLPWGNSQFTVKRYRINKTDNLDLVEENSSEGSTLNVSAALPPDALELIVLQRRK
jgi:hypothetical protein